MLFALAGTCFVVACSFDGPSDSLLPGRARGAASSAPSSASSQEPDAPPNPPSRPSAPSAPSPGTDGGSTPASEAGSPVEAGAPKSGFDAFQQRNLDIVNMYRAAKGIAPLSLDLKLSAFALAGSQELAADHLPHQHFLTASSMGTIFSSGFVGGAAENQGSPTGWPVLAADPMQNELVQIDSIEQAMYSEGPGGGHHDAIMNPAFTRLGVGLLEVSGQLYLTNDFSP